MLTIFILRNLGHLFYFGPRSNTKMELFAGLKYPIELKAQFKCIISACFRSQKVRMLQVVRPQTIGKKNFKGGILRVWLINRKLLHLTDQCRNLICLRSQQIIQKECSHPMPFILPKNSLILQINLASTSITLKFTGSPIASLPPQICLEGKTPWIQPCIILISWEALTKMVIS